MIDSSQIGTTQQVRDFRRARERATAWAAPAAEAKAPARLTSTELALAATVARLVDSHPILAEREKIMAEVLGQHGPTIMKAAVELQDVREALRGVRGMLEDAEQASRGTFDERMTAVRENLTEVLQRVGWVLP